MKENKKIGALVLCVAMISIAIMVGCMELSTASFDFTMDDNTREAITSLNSTYSQIADFDHSGIYMFNESDCNYIGDKNEYWCVNRK